MLTNISPGEPDDRVRLGRAFLSAKFGGGKILGDQNRIVMDSWRTMWWSNDGGLKFSRFRVLPSAAGASLNHATAP
jgi:hypothetical protein